LDRTAAFGRRFLNALAARARPGSSSGREGVGEAVVQADNPHLKFNHQQ
jgi:hypothetical protein